MESHKFCKYCVLYIPILGICIPPQHEKGKTMKSPATEAVQPNLAPKSLASQASFHITPVGIPPSCVSMGTDLQNSSLN